MSAVLVLSLALSGSAIGATSDVTYQATWNTSLTYPARVASAPGGGVYVTDPPMKQVVHLSSTGTLVAAYTVSQGPVGIAVHADGRVFISRQDGVIGVYSSAFALLGTVNASPFTLSGPNDLAMHSIEAELYAVDSESHRVLVFREILGAWTLVRSWGLEGTSLGEFTTPQAIAVDTGLDHVIVTDTDNFRIQVFDTTGIMLFKFGYRLLYLPTEDVAWTARTEGVDTDGCGNIYLADALMGTVRVFSAAGGELDAAHLPAVGYGTGAGQLRAPADLTIDDVGRMYIANTNNGAVEVFTVACTAAVASVEQVSLRSTSKKAASIDRPLSPTDPRLTPEQRIRLLTPDNPADIVPWIGAATYNNRYDLNSDQVVDMSDLELAVEQFGAGSVDDFLAMHSNTASHPALQPPHIIDLPDRCGRCHSMDGAPGGTMLTAAGQENLCQSCHSAGKIAGEEWIGPSSLHNSHPWGVAADSGVSQGLSPGSVLADHLDNGNVRCGTCHNPHESSEPGTCTGGVCVGGPFNGSVCRNASQCEPKVPYMREEIYGAEDHLASQGGTPAVYALRRVTVMDPTLCGECHTDIVSQWSIVGHADTHADPWTHYDWSLGNNWLCTGPGTPRAYCTGEGAGTAASASAAVCTGPGTPLACCTGNGTGTCTLAQAMCTGAATPEPCCTGVGTGSCSSRETCRQCHTGTGFIDFSEDFPDGVVATSTHRGALRVIDCLVCHSTHGESQDGKLLRIYDTVRLPTGQVFTGVGEGATCMSCHNGRSIPPTNPSSVSSPHYLNGGAMLEGINAVTTFPSGAGAVAYTLSNSNHTTNGGVNCTTCHMAPGPTSGPGVGLVGGHTFRLKDHESGFENVGNTCATAGCHPGLTTINRTANGDYDGDGVIEGVQTETVGLLALLKDALYSAGAARLLVNHSTGLAATEAEICTGVGTPLACCTGVRTGPTCNDPDAEPTNPYWTLRRCSGGSRNGLPCNGATPTAPFTCPGGTCPQVVPTGDRTATVVGAIWNWEYVDNSGDLGVKNTGYATGLLQIAYKGIMGVPVPGAAYRYSPAP